MTLPHVRDAGDSMLLLEFEPLVDPAVNARALAVAAALRARQMSGVREVRATLRSVAVDYDPLRVDRSAVVAALDAVMAASPHGEPGRAIEIPVAYGGEYGPDLDEVAVDSGLEPRAVVAAHAGREYHAFMVGFMPGFAYLGSVPSALVAPRRATPRVRVPGGSVGIAGSLTGVYPRACPGGWALVGRTQLPMFDLSQGSLVRPGDRVRFVPMGVGARLVEAPAPSSSSREPVRDPVATVIRPGLLTTVQDAGRWGHQVAGVPVGGALDAHARCAVNAAVGNAPDAAVLEATLPGLDLRLDRDCTVAVAGADLGAELDGTPIRLGVPAMAAAGAHVRLTERRAGARAYMALAGGLDVPVVFGSRSTELGAGFGGFEGRALRAGDRLAVDTNTRSASQALRLHSRLPSPGVDVRLRVLLGPHDTWFTPAALDALERTRFLVTPNSNRVGYRLQGDVPLARATLDEMISDATVIGGLQVPHDGQPILLMVDRQVTGGYPIVATVITADLPLAGQLAPGDWVRFAVCTRSDALAALRLVERT